MPVKVTVVVFILASWMAQQKIRLIASVCCHAAQVAKGSTASRHIL
jgi:hypothetical protein